MCRYEISGGGRMKYRTKLVTVEAFKYDGDLLDKDV